MKENTLNQPKKFSPTQKEIQNAANEVAKHLSSAFVLCDPDFGRSLSEAHRTGNL